MSWWSNLIGSEVSVGQTGPETRSNSLENPSVSLDDPSGWSALFGSVVGHTGETVTVERAMGIPAFWAAVDAISKTIATLPLHLYRKTADGGREKAADTDPLQRILRDQVNIDYLTSFEWRRGAIVQFLTRGRSLTFIERNRAGRATNLWPLDIDRVTVKLNGHRRQYIERVDGGPNRVYDAGEIIDLIWMPGSTPGSHLDPIVVHRDTLGGVLAVDKFSSRAFRNGGISPLKLKVPANMSPQAGQKAVEGISNALSSGGMVLPIFGDMDLTAVGFDASKMQLLELQRFQVEQIARIFAIQPSKIQDNSRSTYSNTEQQGLAFKTETIQPIVEMFEAELLAKLFSDKNRSHYVKFNMDGLTRGDLASRYAAYQTAITGGFITPNEARGWEDLVALEGGDSLFMQGANVKLEDLGNTPLAPAPAAEPDTQEIENEDEPVMALEEQ